MARGAVVALVVLALLSAVDGASGFTHNAGMELSAGLTLLLALAQPLPEVGTRAAPQVETGISRNFTFVSPHLRMGDEGLRVDGQVCRRANYFGMSPLRIRLEALGSDGHLLAAKTAYLPVLSRRADQRCAHYAAAFERTLEPVAKLRICVAALGACSVRH